jgi:Fe-S-cluster containining protein
LIEATAPEGLAAQRLLRKPLLIMSANQVFLEYERHVAAVDAEFGRVSRRFAGRMHCGKGCSMCCSQMFSISLVEAAYISRAVRTMPEEQRRRLQSAARDYTVRAKELAGTGDGDSEDEEAITPRPGLRLPCPALVGDACSIYNARPIICRKWGIPVFNPGKPSELQACELNFRPGEEIEIEGLLEPQVELLEQWVQLKGRAQKTFEHPKMTATVAEAILKDYEEILVGRSSGAAGDSDRPVPGAIATG